MLNLIAVTTPVGPDAQVDSLLTLDPFLVTAMMGTLIPILVGFFTKASTSPAVKAVALAVLSTVGGMVNVAATDGGGAVISEDMVKSAFLTFIAAVAIHFGVLRPTGVTAVVQDAGPITDT